MKVRELAAILRELEKHPRITDVTVGDLRVKFRDATDGFGGVERSEGERLAPGYAETGDVTVREALELPDGVYDPRKAIEKAYSKARAPRGESA
jgi:hypothetical protein